MSIKFHHWPRNLYFLGALFFLLVGQSKIACGRSSTHARKEFDKLARTYRFGHISAGQYLSYADSLTGKLMSQGIYFKNEELVNLLSLYQEIAWSKKKYGYARAGYYLIFLNNARTFDQTGVSKYYVEELKQERMLWLLVISIAASLVVLVIYLIMLFRSRKAKAQIDALNNAVNMQIIAMEEAKFHAVREEQQRMGQDLHDGLSSSIAAIRHQLEALLMDTEDISLKNKLDTLRAETVNAYDAIRNKSHDWFSGADKQGELPIEKQIKLLINSALPDSRYHKIIQIDNNSLIHASADIHVALVRIIQEAVTNIIKHAKAKSVVILIYEEKGILVMVIDDDGIGLTENKTVNRKSTMGLGSIYRRVQYLNGEMKLHSDKNGTEIIVSIPLIFSKKRPCYNPEIDSFGISSRRPFVAQNTR